MEPAARRQRQPGHSRATPHAITLRNHGPRQTRLTKNTATTANHAEAHSFQAFPPQRYLRYQVKGPPSAV